MNMKNTILAILGIALIAIVSVGAVSADETLENVGCGLTPSVSGHTYEKGILTIPISNNACGDLNDIPGLEAIGAWDYTPCPEPSLPDVRADGNEVMLVGYTPYHGNDDQPSVYDADACGYFHNGDFPKSFNVDDWNGYTAGEWEPKLYDPSLWAVGSAADTTSMEFGDI